MILNNGAIKAHSKKVFVKTVKSPIINLETKNFLLTFLTTNVYNNDNLLVTYGN